MGDVLSHRDSRDIFPTKCPKPTRLFSALLGRHLGMSTVWGHFERSTGKVVLEAGKKLTVPLVAPEKSAATVSTWATAQPTEAVPTPLVRVNDPEVVGPICPLV